MIPDRSDLSDAKRALLEKYLNGNPPQTVEVTNPLTQHSQENSITVTSADSEPLLVPIIPIQSHGSRPPFFYLHPHVEGGAFYCFTLAHYAGQDQPFYVLEPCSFEGLPIPPTLEDMAAAYIKSMRTIQQEGPYFLGGFCGGGLIAFEAAQQLHAAGQEVAFLLLIEAKDGPALHRMHFRKSLGNFVRRIGVGMHLSQEKQCDVYIFLEKNYIYLRHVYDYLRIHLRRLQNTVGLRSAEHTRHGRIGDKAGIKFPRPRDFGITGKYIGEASEDWIGKFVWAISRYNTRRYPGKVTYIWAKHTMEQEQLHYHGKERGEVPEANVIVTHLIPGNHSTIINEEVQHFAECLCICLHKAQETRLSEK